MSSQAAAQSPGILPAAQRPASENVPAQTAAVVAPSVSAGASSPAVAVGSTSAGRGPSALGASGQRVRRTLLGLLLPVTTLVAIELSVRGGLIPANMLPAPSQIVETLRDLGAQGLLGHIVASTLRVFAGFVAGALLAVLLGAAVGLSRHAEAILDPTFQALRAIPSLAWVPLLLLWLGIDEAPKIVLIAIGAFFPVYMGVASGIRGADRKLIEVARLYQLSNIALTRRVLLPAALPAILTGLRNGLSLAWMFMVAAELIAASKGLGYLLSDGRETSRADIVLAAIALLAILGKISDSLMAVIEKRSLAWRDSYA
ncbi:ABC transporter permease subunit [Pseudoduganella sp. FT25W]|uniref:ABC transporter permease subunit n=1 Tax=Duganella alba TaxID=2666081 RepID=A0A6L5Q8V8_9BURK|nr:ABC transporter permease subunit [Duganella alba]MRX14647.1 ABC transporter permease subunit [Duganella alba]